MDSIGGAFRAAYRLHNALVHNGIDSRMLVLEKDTEDDRVICGARRITLINRLVNKISNRWRLHTQHGWHTNNPMLHSFGQVSTGLVNEINSSYADILNLHWICKLLSVEDIGRLKKPIVWRLADMWPFCGGEHYELDSPAARFRNGYLPHNRPAGERGPDLNRQTWEAKRRAWARQHFYIVCTTHWMAKCARESVLFRDCPIHIIPNTLDTVNTWRPIPKNIARGALNLPLDKKLIMMGAAGGLANPYKGADLLHEAMARVAVCRPVDTELIIFGQDKPAQDQNWPCPVHWLGKITDDRLLALAYSATDVMMVPSRQEAFGQTASEAQACGTPVVAFDNSGPADIVTHKKTGWLAKAFDTKDLADGIVWLLQNEARYATLATAARQQAVERFSEPVVASAYSVLYEHVLAGKRYCD
jgi:glycosyltransferase involved in cell wall biosynthesis